MAVATKPLRQYVELFERQLNDEDTIRLEEDLGEALPRPCTEWVTTGSVSYSFPIMQLTDVLVDLSDAGWEVVCLFTHYDTPHFLLKRPIPRQ